MKRLLLAFVIAIATTIVVLSAEVRLSDGSEAPLKVIEHNKDRTLVQTKRGIGTIPSDWLAGQKLGALGIEAAIERADELLQRGEEENAYLSLRSIVEEDPANPRARRLLALAQRRRGRFEAALFLLNGLAAEEKASDGKAKLTTLVERAEVAVLLGDTKIARKALSPLKFRRETKILERDLNRQLKGGKVIVFAKPQVLDITPEALATARSGYDNLRGTNLLATKIADKIEKQFNASPYGLPATEDFVTRIKVKNKVHADVLAEYRQGGSETRFANFVSEADVIIAVGDKRWLSIPDWQKRIEIDAAARALRQAFPNSLARVEILGQKGENIKSRYTVGRATVLRKSNTPQITLNTTPKGDANRDTEITRDLKNYRRSTGGGR